MSFNSRFKHIFSEIFQSEGFKYCSKLNVFAKMLNEDLLAFIGVKSAPIWNKRSKGFMITAGIISTYYDSIEKNSVLMIGHERGRTLICNSCSNSSRRSKGFLPSRSILLMKMMTGVLRIRQLAAHLTLKALHHAY